MPNDYVKDLRVHVDREFWSRSYDVSAVRMEGWATRTGLKRYGAKVEWVEIGEAFKPPEMFSLTEAQAQLLIDGLWALGLRPTDGAGTAGSMAATQRHLEDMRSLVFKTKPKDERQ